MNNFLPSVSVIITNYNYAQFVCSAIQSAIDQNYPNIKEIIIVDDRSTDNSVEIIKKFLENQKYTKRDFRLIINNQNGGPAGARNSGILAATGDILSFLDADDLYYPDKISKSIPYFLQPEVALVYSDYMVMDIKKNTFQIEFKHSYDLRMLMNSCIISTNSLMRMSAVQKVGLFDIRFRGTEDYHMYLKLSRENILIHIPEVLFMYRLHGKNITTTTNHNQFAYDIASFKRELNI